METNIIADLLSNPVLWSVASFIIGAAMGLIYLNLTEIRQLKKEIAYYKGQFEKVTGKMSRLEKAIQSVIDQLSEEEKATLGFTPSGMKLIEEQFSDIKLINNGSENLPVLSNKSTDKKRVI